MNENQKKEEYNIINEEEILNLRKSLILKDQLISKLQKELELNSLRYNLGMNESAISDENKSLNNSLKKYDSYKNLNETLSNPINSINKNNTVLEDIQKQIFELNLELRAKKNLLSKIKSEKDEIKSNTFTNWNTNQNNKN